MDLIIVMKSNLWLPIVLDKKSREKKSYEQNLYLFIISDSF